MSSLAEVKLNLTVEDSTGVVLERDLIPVRFGVGAGQSGQLQTLTLTTGNNTISVPTGSVLMLLELTSSAPVLTLKGSSGDTGIPITPSANPAGVAAMLTLGTNPVVIIANAGATYQVVCTFV